MHQKSITLRSIDSLAVARVPTGYSVRTASLRLIDLSYAGAHWSKLFLNHTNVLVIPRPGAAVNQLPEGDQARE